MNKKLPLKAPILLKKYHVLDPFDSESESLNTYLQQFAYLNIRNNSSRTYVTARENRVVGYYTIAPGSVKKEEAPSRIGKGLSRHPVPVVIIARLAVDKTEQKTGIGKGLLKDALIRIVSAADIIGGRAILVHAKDNNAALFYKKFGFEESPIDRFHLYFLLKDIKISL